MSLDRRVGRKEQIQAALEALGGTAELQQIYLWMERNCDLSPNDLSESRYSGTSNYQHAVRSTLVLMKKEGTVIQVGRAVYRLM